MLVFTEDNVATLEMDLLEELNLPEQFVVNNMHYNPTTHKVLCCVRKLAPCAEKFLTMDEYIVTIETGSEGGLFSITEIEEGGWRGDFSQHVATYRPGYELELV